MSTVLNRYEQLAARPFGKRIFSIAFALKAPYFGSVRPYFAELRPNYAEVRLRKRRRVHNHIKTVHVIAIANGLEAAMGALAEASIPPNRRWIPKGMQLDYTALANSDIVCVAQTPDADWSSPGVQVQVSARRSDGTIVVSGVIDLHVSDRARSGSSPAVKVAP